MNVIQRQLRLLVQPLNQNYQNVRYFWRYPKFKRGNGEDRRVPKEPDERAPYVQHYGFNYYPRPNEVEIPYTPSKLLMVQRVARWSGNPKWDKKILKDLGLNKNMGEVVLVKNTPQMNKLLYQVKHLIKIKPVVFPNGEPTADDVKVLGATVLNEYGEMEVRKSLKPPTLSLPPPEISEAPPKSAKELGTPSDETMRRHLRMKWLTGMDNSGFV
ncbi:uncharacterized protein LOC132199645 [Neocloeon triangulifer]|uniref:uncharacterized protein LOC132199645 n=1 Tax=Neocloeon triangulifer TaxID=2078957 RepID=UPI00286F2A7F|nr:uncharacterized protein LOC132199645 [Neocloeon triangulifer]